MSGQMGAAAPSPDKHRGPIPKRYEPEPFEPFLQNPDGDQASLRGLTIVDEHHG